MLQFSTMFPQSVWWLPPSHIRNAALHHLVRTVLPYSLTYLWSKLSPVWSRLIRSDCPGQGRTSVLFPGLGLLVANLAGHSLDMTYREQGRPRGSSAPSALLFQILKYNQELRGLDDFTGWVKVDLGKFWRKLKICTFWHRDVSPQTVEDNKHLDHCRQSTSTSTCAH